MASNPIVFLVAANSRSVLSATAHAAYYQRVTLTFSDTSVVLEGTGEGAAMRTPSGEEGIDLPPALAGYEITALFEFSTNGPNGQFQRARVQDPTTVKKSVFTITSITSEDGGDNDNNDTYLTVVSIDDATAPLGRASVAESSSGQLELHAKTYYDNPFVDTGDEHSFIIPVFSGTFGTLFPHTMSWSANEGEVYNDKSPLGGWIISSVELFACQHPGMHDRTLKLSSVVSYWGSFPTGYKTANWTWSVGGSGEYTVTRVTE
jgi:hypothetical protein